MLKWAALLGFIGCAAFVACSGFSSEETGAASDGGVAADDADASAGLDADLTRKRLFVTSTTYDGLGAGGGDQSCIDLAADAGLGGPGNWAAWLSKGGGLKSAPGRMSWKGAWYDLTRTIEVIEAQGPDGGFPLPTRPISWTERGDTLGNVHVWTGTNADGESVTGALCVGWSDATENRSGVFGTLDVGPSWTRASSLDPCNAFNHLYCFEQ